jgi:hypothetical protein
VQRLTVADVLAEEVRRQLERYGFMTVTPEVMHTVLADRIPRSTEEAIDLVSHSKLNGSALYIEIIHWEPDIPLHPRRILVALYASLIDIAAERMVWSVHMPLHPIPTPGIANRWIAYLIAARQAAEDLLAPLDLGRPSS